MSDPAKAILNSLRCPLCKSALDLVDWRMPNPAPKYNFCCSSNWEHYRIFFIHWEGKCELEYETLTIYEGKHKYEITQEYNLNIASILIHQVDPEGRVLEHTKLKSFMYAKHIFDFQNTNREKIVNRVQTILVFQ